jgi:hypothetical protein
MSDIQDFISHLNKYTGPAIGNRFKVTINTPKALIGLSPNLKPTELGKDDIDNNNISGGYARNLSFQCETAELPGRTLATFDARTYGPSKKYPYQTTYEDLNLTFICMNNLPSRSGRGSQNLTGLPEKRFFDNWMNVINPINTYNFEYKDGYSTKISIIQYDIMSTDNSPNNNAVNYTVDFIEAFPISVNQLPLNWADDSILKLTVTFAYTRWEKFPKGQNKPPLLRKTNTLEVIPGIELSYRTPPIAYD